MGIIAGELVSGKDDVLLATECCNESATEASCPGCHPAADSQIGLLS